MENLKKQLIGEGYSATGYGRGVRKGKKIYLINGKAYARDKQRADSSFEPCVGELANYVRVNCIREFKSFYQVGLEREHLPYVNETEVNLTQSKKTYEQLEQENKELLEALKLSLNMFGRGYEPKEGAAHTAGSRVYLKCINVIKKHASQ